MKLNRLGAFTFGVVITAISVGAVTFANAAGDVTIKACANKTPGAMRYISKGSCKKTETSLTWSQMGPQGLPGATGSAGPVGVSGSNASTVNVQDAAGTMFAYVGFQIGAILWNGLIWTMNSDAYTNNSIPTQTASYFSDAECSIPIFTESSPDIYSGVSAQSTIVTTSDKKSSATSRVLKAYKRKGSLIPVNSAVNYSKFSGRGCTVLPGGKENYGSSGSPNWVEEFTHYYEAEETAPLVFVPPLKFVVG
jgi:hypothetical protein